MGLEKSSDPMKKPQKYRRNKTHRPPKLRKTARGTDLPSRSGTATLKLAFRFPQSKVRSLAILHRIPSDAERSKNCQNLAAVAILTPIAGAVMTQSAKIDSNASHAVDRLVSLDVYRGMVMFLMVAKVLHLSSLPEIFSGSGYCTLSLSIVAFVV